MSRPPKPPSGRTAPARPQFKADIPELVCKRFKPDGTPCEARFSTLKGYLSHGRSVKKHSAPGFVPPQPQPQTQAMTPPQQDDHPGLYVDGPAGLSDYWLDTMPYVELLDLQVRVAETIRRRHCAVPDYAGDRLPARQTLHVSTPLNLPPPLEKNEEEEEEVDLLALAGEDPCLYLELLKSGLIPLCDDRS